MFRLLIVLFLLISFSASLQAATTTTQPGTITLAGGVLSVTSSGSISFPPVLLDGEDHQITAQSAPTFTLTDASGSGNGWNVTFQSTDFTAGAGKTIPASVFFFTPSGGTIVKITGQNTDPSGGPRETGGGPVSLETAKKILTTSAKYGMGKYYYSALPLNFILNVDASTMAGSYTATVNATISTGP